jgi:hypothetical protein
VPTERDDYFAEREPGRWPPGWWAPIGLIVAIVVICVLVIWIAL